MDLRQKKEGNKYTKIYTVTRDILFKVYLQKMYFNSDILNKLISSDLPFTHYYISNNVIIRNKHEWTGELWTEVKDDILKTL